MVQSSPRTNPFPGLRPFELDEEHLFFGREGQADELLTRLNRTHFLAVVGTSGSGKSSLVRAGLLPSLYSGLMQNASSGWRVSILRPGSAPIANIAAALNVPDVFGIDPASDDTVIRTALTESTLRRGPLGLVEVTQQARMAAHENLLVVVDQFEELFRFKAQAQDRKLDAEDEAAAFVKLLLGAVNQREVPIFVVLTMRSDFLGDCAQFRDLPETLNDSQYLIPRLTREQLRSAIEGPVAVGGATITPRLVNRLLNDTGDNPDQLPILQHALMRTWDYWEDQHQPQTPIDIEHYEAIGGMAEALSRHADQIYEDLTNDPTRRIARTLFKRLTDRGGDNRDIRRPTTLAEVCAVANASEVEVVAVVDKFRGARRSFLMPPVGVALRSDTVIDISHESLMRNWQRLKGWVAEEAQSAQIYKRLADTAELHEKGEAGYWRDPELTIGLTWLKEQQPTQAWAERYAPNFDQAVVFLEASDEARNTDAAEKEKSRRREVYRLRTFLALLGGLSLLTGGAAVYAFNQQQEAKTQAQIADQQRAAAEQSRAVAEQSRKDAYEQRDIAQQRAQEAQEAQKRAQEQQIVAEAAQRAETEQKQIAEDALLRAERGEADATLQARLAREQTSIAEKNALDALSATERAALEAQRAENQAFNSEIQTETYKAEGLLYNGLNFEATLKALGIGQTIKHLNQNIEHTSLFSSQAKLDPFRQIDSSSKKSLLLQPAIRLQVISILREATYHQGFSEKNILRGHIAAVGAAYFSPDGQFLASASDDGSIKIWDIRGNEIKTFTGHTDIVRDISFNPNGEILASGSDDGTVRLWSLRGNYSKILTGHNSEVYSVSFSPDGKTLASGGRDSAIILWDMQGAQINILRGHTDTIFDLDFSPNGEILASASGDRTIKLWDKNGNLLNKVLSHDQGVQTVSFSSDGTLLASGSLYNGTITLWDSAGNELNSFRAHSQGVKKIDFSPAGQTFASASQDATIKLFDINGTELQTLNGHKGYVNSINFSPDGEILASASGDTTIRLWAVKSLDIERVTEPGSSFRQIKFSPDGRLFVAADDNSKTAILWNRDGKKQATLVHHEDVTRNDVIRDVDFSPDGNTIASASTDGTIKLWNRDGSLLNTFLGHDNYVLSVTFSRDGKYIASSSGDGDVKLWNRNGQIIKAFIGHKSPVQSIDFSNSGQYLASADDDGIVSIWDVRSLSDAPITTFRAHSDWIHDVKFNPNKEIIVTASRDGTAKLWNVEGRELSKFEGHTSAIREVAFSSDGQVLATASNDYKVKLWDLSGLELQTLEGHSDFVNGLDFSPDGQTLASASGDSSIILWNFNLDDLMAKSCGWLRDYMANPATPTADKALCRGYLPSVPLQSALPGPLHWVANVRAFLSDTFGNPTVDSN